MTFVLIVATNAKIWSWFLQSTRMPGTAPLLRHNCLLSTQSTGICQVFGQYLLVNFTFPVTFQIFKLSTLSKNGDIMLYNASCHASRMFFKRFPSRPIYTSH